MMLLGSGIETFDTHPRRSCGNGITPEMLAHGARLSFSPKMTRTVLRVESVCDLPVHALRLKYKGLILGVDGIMECDDETSAPAVIAILSQIKEQIRICALSNCTKPVPALIQLGIPLVTDVPPMPDPRAFDVAVSRYLQNGRVVHTEQCAMVGSDFLTHGGCRNVGMDFILVNPVTGKNGEETTALNLLRQTARRIAAVHDLARSWGKRSQETAKQRT
jgi:predicted HAD superfamily phosphohydrolase YqeG